MCKEQLADSDHFRITLEIISLPRYLSTSPILEIKKIAVLTRAAELSCCRRLMLMFRGGATRRNYHIPTQNNKLCLTAYPH